MTFDVDRAQVLAYRVAAHELDRVIGRLGELAMLDLGVQDTPYGSTRLALGPARRPTCGCSARPPWAKQRNSWAPCRPSCGGCGRTACGGACGRAPHLAAGGPGGRVALGE